ncbi:MAG TPA: GTPase ObgE, partial [Vampirovibrionales bacterium]
MNKFVDFVKIDLEAGNGGDGVVAWRREKYVDRGGPAGGDGGKGGNIWLEASSNYNTLLDFRYKHKFKAPDGDRGGKSNRSGKAGEDLIIPVPVGTVIQEEVSGEKITIGDLHEHGQRILIAKSGRGGRGNQHFATSVKQSPHFCEPGKAGQKRTVTLELKLVAHIGIIGKPNAGKSTLISRLSACKPEIAGYPFTTITPNLGIMQLYEGKSLTIADIPGLIEGAAEGKGLGHQFLRHVERTKVLIHLIDGAIESEDECLKAYKTVIAELRSYNTEILEKKQLLIINKKDSFNDEFAKKLEKIFIENNLGQPMFISAATGLGLEELKRVIVELDKTEKLFEYTQFKEEHRE